MKSVLVIFFFALVAVQCSEISGPEVDYENADPVFLDQLKQRLREFIAGDFFKNVEGFLKPLEQNLRQKLSEFGLKTLDHFKQFIKDKITPLERNLKSVLENLVDRFASFLPNDIREQLKVKLLDFISTLRQPISDRLNALFEKVRKELGNDVEVVADPVFLGELQNRLKDLLSQSTTLKKVLDFVKSLELSNLRQKLSELNIKSLDDFKQLIKDKVQPLEEKLKSIVDSLKQRLGNNEALKERISNLLNKFRQPILDRLKALFEKVRKELGNDVEVVADPVLLAELQNHFKQLLSQSGALKKILDFVKSLNLPNLRQKLSELNIKSLDDFKQLIKDKAQPLEERLKSIVDSLKERFGKLLSEEKKEALKERIRDLVNKFRQPLLDRLKSLFEKVRKELGNDVEVVADPVFLNEIKEFLSANFFQKIEQFIKSLEQNLRGKLAEMNIRSLSDIKELIKQKLAPLEERFESLKDSIVERFGKFLSKESRDALKAKITDFINAKLRQPLLERVKILLQRIQKQLEN